MGFRKLLSLFLISVLILTIVAGCAAPELNAIELVPRDANMIATIQVSEILNDKDLRDAYAKAEKERGQPQTVDEALDELVEETGIDLRDISEAVVFADMTAMEVEVYLGIIVEGTFDKKQFIDNIEEETEMDFTVSEYNGYKLYVDQDEEFAVTLLSEKMVILGSTKAVKDAIDVSKGEREKVSGAVLDTYNRFVDMLIKVAFEVPEETRESIAEEPIPDDMPISMEYFADMDTVGFALNKEAEMITVQIDSRFLSAESAEDAKDTISGAISFFRGMSPDREIKELLGKIEVGITDFWVTINFEITVAEIEELVETFQP